MAGVSNDLQSVVFTALGAHERRPDLEDLLLEVGIFVVPQARRRREECSVSVFIGLSLLLLESALADDLVWGRSIALLTVDSVVE